MFAGWDVHVHPNPGRSSSLQVSLDTLEQASETGFTSQPRETRSARELMMALRPDAIATYLEVLAQLDVASVDSASPAVERATSGQEPSGAGPLVEGPRRRAFAEIAFLARDRRFRTHVLRAYGERCAFVTLGWGIVQAAHIQAVTDGGPDVIPNGLAACCWWRTTDASCSTKISPCGWASTPRTAGDFATGFAIACRYRRIPGCTRIAIRSSGTGRDRGALAGNYFLCFVLCVFVWCFLGLCFLGLGQPVMVMGVFWWISLPLAAVKAVGRVSFWLQ